MIKLHGKTLLGGVDLCDLEEGTIKVAGYSLYYDNGRFHLPKRIIFRLNEETIGECSLNIDRPDVADYWNISGESREELIRCGFAAQFPVSHFLNERLKFEVLADLDGNGYEKLESGLADRFFKSEEFQKIFERNRVFNLTEKKSFIPNMLLFHIYRIFRSEKFRKLSKRWRILDRIDKKLFGEDFILSYDTKKSKKIARNDPDRKNVRSTADAAWNKLMIDGYAHMRSGSLEEVNGYFNYLISGDRKYFYLKYIWDKYFTGKPPVIASLGTGAGNLERSIAQDLNLPYSRIDGYELSPKLVEFANEKARSHAIPDLYYHQADLNSLSLNENSCDAIIFFHSLHHVDNLSGCLSACRKALKDDGILVVIDYIGKNRLQVSKQQARIMNAVLSLLPRNYRKMTSGYKDYIKPAKPRAVARRDPSEAIRSEEIMSELNRHFNFIEITSMGGSIINPLLAGIAFNFDESSYYDRKLINLLCELEHWYEAQGYIKSDYIFGILKKKQ